MSVVHGWKISVFFEFFVVISATIEPFYENLTKSGKRKCSLLLAKLQMKLYNPDTITFGKGSEGKEEGL